MKSGVLTGETGEQTRGSKIRRRLAAGFAAVLLIFSLLIGTVFLLLFRQHTMRINRIELENKATSIARTLAEYWKPESGRGMMGHGMGGYGMYLQFLDELAMADVWIVDEDMELMTYGYGHHGQIEYGDLPSGAEAIVERVFRGEVTYSEEFSQLLDTPTLTVGAPIHDNGAVRGAVLLHSPVSGVDEAVFQGVLALTAGIGIALAVAMVASAALAYSFTKPLHQMRNTALRLADGDYNAKTGVAQDDEIGQLAHTLDDLAGRLDSAARERAALERMREEFVANVSHELRTPVTVLRGSLEILCDGTVDDPSQIQDYYEHMLAESLHMERLVNDLLDLSRLQNAEFRLEIRHIDLCAVISDAARAIRRAAEKRNVSVRMECPEKECAIQGDYSRIRQMLLIVMDNAVKFSPEGGEVSICLLEKEEHFFVTVTDHGSGIAAEDLPYIFERFHKETSARNPNGTGLGLAIARQIADRHSIHIIVTSDPGKETVFSFRFVPDGEVRDGELD